MPYQETCDKFDDAMLLSNSSDDVTKVVNRLKKTSMIKDLGKKTEYGDMTIDLTTLGIIHYRRTRKGSQWPPHNCSN